MHCGIFTSWDFWQWKDKWLTVLVSDLWLDYTTWFLIKLYKIINNIRHTVDSELLQNIPCLPEPCDECKETWMWELLWVQRCETLAKRICVQKKTFILVWFTCFQLPKKGQIVSKSGPKMYYREWAKLQTKQNTYKWQI